MYSAVALEYDLELEANRLMVVCKSVFAILSSMAGVNWTPYTYVCILVLH